MLRVNAAARTLGAETFTGVGQEANRAWIREMMEKGHEICDIGPDLARRKGRSGRTKPVKPGSDAYKMELLESRGYEAYRRMWDPRSGF